MNKLFKTSILFILFINLFVSSSNPSDRNQNKNPDSISNDDLLKITELSDEQVESILSFFYLLISLTRTVQSLHFILLLERDDCFSFHLKRLNNLTILNTSMYSVIKVHYPDKCENFSTENLNKGHILTKNEINSISSVKEKNDKLTLILQDVISILQELLILFRKLAGRFSSLELYLSNIEATLLDLYELSIQRLQLISSENEKLMRFHKENEYKADLAAHQLLGCCQDGTCGSLNKKKLEKKNKKASKKKRKSDKKLELGAYAKEDELENIDQPESNDERQLKNFDQNSHEESNYIQNKDLRGNQVGYSKDILIDSINLTSKILGILSSILELEINLHNLISKSKILYRYLLKERVRNYESSKKNRLNSLLRESLKYVNLDFAQDQKYDQRNNLLKCCSLYESNIKEENKKNNYCPHCKCKNCNRNLNKRKSIYSVN